MPGRQAIPNIPCHLISQGIIERMPRRHGDEQRHPVGAIRSVNTQDESLGDLIHRFHYLVDVRRTHADSVAVQRGIATPVDDQRSAFGDCHPITVPPDPRRLTIGPFMLEICSLVARSVWVVPETDRHTGHRLQDHHLAHFSDQGAAIRRPAVQIDTQVAGGQLTRMGGHFWRTAGEGGTDIGTPRQRRNRGPGMRTRPFEKIRRER
ncbi:Uncharacterised protein [Mycobacteroides abscessus subsp. massiliense]|nr:Uncharacterised protein [Mycobacteroides abscessus subsp. massiliense]